MHQMTIGVIGGSGLYEIEGLTNIEEVRLETPFGEPSDAFITGMLGDVKMVFLPRHGRGHRFLPSEVPYRANIYGMKKLGVQRIISVSAVGSMKEEIPTRSALSYATCCLKPGSVSARRSIRGVLTSVLKGPTSLRVPSRTFIVPGVSILSA
jgi:hypothetical protein